jgi:5'-deoxynucleotidase YfbR-like HD superfamily hydrolase
MAQPSVDDLQMLFRDIVLPFYQIDRATPLRFAPGTYENDAEHSWSLALMACALAPHIDKSLDVGRIAEFATVHDLVEVYAGDTSNFGNESDKASKDKREHAALRKIQTKLTAFPWISETIEQYEMQISEEAKFVKSVDKLITLLIDYLEGGLFYKENRITVAQWKRVLQKHREKASKHSGAFKYYDELWNLLLANPHFFHQEK